MSLIEKWKKKRFKPKGSSDGTYRRVFDNRSIKTLEADLRKVVKEEAEHLLKSKENKMRRLLTYQHGVADMGNRVLQKIFGDEKK